jgi:uncharacterized protein (DUF305 family)
VTISARSRTVGLAVAVASAAACATGRQPAVHGGDLATSPAAQARADGGRPPYTAADVRFMQGMIAHHAQAIWMARLAPTHGARRDVRILAERIEVAQRDEIDFMQRWLRERGQPAPDASPHHQMGGQGTPMPAMVGPMMPGMLTHEQMMQLEAARGPEFDRLFLTFMIQHHEGALTMVRQLFSSPGAGQDVNVFRFASDVEADQTTEIDRMQSMLATSSEGRRP